MFKAPYAIDICEFLERFFHVRSYIVCHCCHIVKSTKSLELGMDCFCDFVGKVLLIETGKLKENIAQLEFR
jgi:hypothetical protein